MRLIAHKRLCFVLTALGCVAGTAFSLPPQRATRTTIVSATPNPSVVGQPVKVSFRVEPTVGGLAPSGNVMVMGGGQCQAPVQAGGCSLIMHEAGTAALTAIYYGDRNFLPSTSPQALTLKVTDFSLSTSPSATSAEGAKPSYHLTLAPRGGFTGRVSLSCAELPAGASCTFTPSTVTLNGEDNAGSVVTLQTSPSTPSAGTISVTGVAGSGDPASGGLTRRVLLYVDVSSGPSNASSRPSAASGESVSGEVIQAVREHFLLFMVDLAAIVILGGFLLWFAIWLLRRERARKERRPRPQIVMVLWFVGIVLAGIVIAIVVGGDVDISKNQMGVAINGWLLFAFGISFVFYGLSTYRLYRFHSDTAASTIRSMAMGFVEIFGSAMPAGQPAAPSPIFAKPCLCCEVEVEIAAPVAGAAQDVDWSNYFTERPAGRFYLQDQTGKVLVDVRGAHFDVISYQCEIKMSPSGEPQILRGSPTRRTRALDTPNDAALAAYVSGGGMADLAERKPFKPGHTFRLTERCIRPYLRYSVAGTCVENRQPKDELDRNLIVKGTNEKTFEISWRPEREQQDQLLRRAKAAIYGGAALAAVSLAMILVVFYL